MSNETEAFETWGMLELFGHQKLAGRITEATIGGCHFIRIDVPTVGDAPEYTRYFTQGAIYGMSPTSEDVARRLASNLRARPVHAYDIREEPKQIEVASVNHADRDLFDPEEDEID